MLNTSIFSSQDQSIDNIGPEIYGWVEKLFPLCRSLTGPGTLQTMEFLQSLLPGLTIHSVPSGTRAGDWIVPNEWTIHDAFVKDSSGNRVIDFQENNLHVIGYSTPIDKHLSLDQLQPHLRSIAHIPTAVPYHTTYYKPFWGFCLTDERRKSLKQDTYHVKIDSTLAPGNLHYADLVIPGESKDEILLSSYCCHPSLANNELSGPTVLTAVARWLMAQPKRRFSYRIVFTVETIGAILYVNKHLDHLRARVKAGYVLTCCGDNNRYGFMRSRLGDTDADRALCLAMAEHASNAEEYDFLEIGGSDNIQYCSPNVDLPVCTIMRSAHGTYREYHTSLDDLSFVSAEGLQGAFEVCLKTITLLENNVTWRLQTIGEPQLGRYGLYPSQESPWPWEKTKLLKKFLAFADGNHSVLSLLERFQCSPTALFDLIRDCEVAGLIKAA